MLMLEKSAQLVSVIFTMLQDLAVNEFCLNVRVHVADHEFPSEGQASAQADGDASVSGRS